jgi:hypothetical protein
MLQSVDHREKFNNGHRALWRAACVQREEAWQEKCRGEEDKWAYILKQTSCLTFFESCYVLLFVIITLRYSTQD